MNEGASRADGLIAAGYRGVAKLQSGALDRLDIFQIAQVKLDLAVEAADSWIEE